MSHVRWQRGWDLPRIPRFGGGEAPLYLEALFALAFVEQKVGWTSIPASFPTYLGLKDMSRRSVEFVLGLTVNEMEVNRQRVEAQLGACRERWKALVEEAHRLAEVASGRVDGLPVDPDLSWDESSSFLAIPEGDDWLDIDELASALKLELRVASERTVPTAESDNTAVETELGEVLDGLNRSRVVRSELLGGLNIERAQLRATVRQLRSIEEDLQRHKDAAKILSLGGEVGAALGADRCPTCHQDVTDSLLPPDSIEHPMSLDENKDFLLKQRDLFQNLQARGEDLVERQEKEHALLSERISRDYARVRALQDTLASASTTPSTAAIQKRVELQARLDTLAKVSLAFSRVSSSLETVREDFRAAKAEAEKLPPVGLPAEDQVRLRSLTASIVRQLDAYGFSTFPASKLQLAEDTYRPMRADFEFGFELSASDAIRLKWAYQLGLLEVTHGLDGAHHPGLLVFDEPRQQETDKVSFHELIAHASRVSSELQVIFTTSEDKPMLHRAVEGLELNLIDFPGYLLQPR